jgi:hypothetical protein
MSVGSIGVGFSITFSFLASRSISIKRLYFPVSNFLIVKLDQGDIFKIKKIITGKYKHLIEINRDSKKEKIIDNPTPIVPTLIDYPTFIFDSKNYKAIPKWKPEPPKPIIDPMIEKIAAWKRAQERNKLIHNFKHYSQRKEVPGLFNKEEEEKLLRPYIEELSEENFRILFKKYAACDDYFNGKQLKEAMKKMKSSIQENSISLLFKYKYNACYMEWEKTRLLKKEKERIKKIQERWDEVYSLDHKFYFNKRSWELFRKLNQSFYTNLNGQKIMKTLNGEDYTKKEGCCQILRLENPL